MERNPHLLFEGCLIGCHAIGAKVAYIYIRGEFHHVQHGARGASSRRRARPGYVGKNIFGTGFDCEIHVHRGAGRVRSRRGDGAHRVAGRQARAAAHQAAVPGRRRACGAARRPSTTSRRSATCRSSSSAAPTGTRRLGPEKNTRAEALLHQRPRREAGRLRVVDGRDRCATSSTTRSSPAASATATRSRPSSPAGRPCRCCCRISSTSRPASTASRRPARCSGSAGVIVMDETTCMVWAAENLLYFYKHESCGKCTPCREGGAWLHRLLGKIERGEGQMKDLDLLLSVANNIMGKTLCAFGDAEATPVLSTDRRVPRRIRSAHPRGPLHGAGALAGDHAQRGGGALMMDATGHRPARRHRRHLRGAAEFRGGRSSTWSAKSRRSSSSASARP